MRVYEYLLGLKLRIARHLLGHNISPDKMRALMTFLRLYVNFSDPETNAKFVHELSFGFCKESMQENKEIGACLL